jgi:hypothetical protein
MSWLARENKKLFHFLPWAYEIQNGMIFISDLVLAPIRSQNKRTDIMGNIFLHYQRCIYGITMKMLERKSEGIGKHAGWLTNNEIIP